MDEAAEASPDFFRASGGHEGSWLLQKETLLFFQAKLPGSLVCPAGPAGGSGDHPLHILLPSQKEILPPSALGCTRPTDSLARTLRPATRGLCRL